MATNAIRVNSSLQVQQQSVGQSYQSLPLNFTASQLNIGGPVPGMVLAPSGGVNISFSPLIQPGVCRIQNLDPTNYVTVGIYDSTIPAFYPLMEILPGESWCFRLSRFIGEELVGTGTHEGHASTVRIEPPHGHSVKVLVEAFDS